LTTKERAWGLISTSSKLGKSVLVGEVRVAVGERLLRLGASENLEASVFAP